MRFFEPQAIIQQATRQHDLGLTALLLLISWGDVAYPLGLVLGLPAVGFAPVWNFSSQQPAESISLQALGDWRTMQWRYEGRRLDDVGAVHGRL